jgi:hypothetical protein
MLAMELEEEAWKQGIIDTIFERMFCMGYFIGAVQARNIIRFFPPYVRGSFFFIIHGKIIVQFRDLFNRQWSKESSIVTCPLFRCPAVTSR